MGILKDRTKCKIYKNFLVQRQCEENLLFWLEVQLMKSDMETPDALSVNAAELIIATYLKDDARYRLNLDSELFDLVKNMTTVSRDMFDTIEEAVLRLMETSTLAQFRQKLDGKFFFNIFSIFFHFSNDLK